MCLKKRMMRMSEKFIREIIRKSESDFYFLAHCSLIISLLGAKSLSQTDLPLMPVWCKSLYENCSEFLMQYFCFRHATNLAFVSILTFVRSQFTQSRYFNSTSYFPLGRCSYKAHFIADVYGSQLQTHHTVFVILRMSKIKKNKVIICFGQIYK